MVMIHGAETHSGKQKNHPSPRHIHLHHLQHLKSRLVNGTVPMHWFYIKETCTQLTHFCGTAKQCDFVLKKKHGSPGNALTALFWTETSQRFSHHLDEAPHGDERRWVCSRYQVHSKGIVTIVTWNPNDLYFWRSTPQNKANLPIKTRGPIWVPGRYLIVLFPKIWGLEIFVLKKWYLCQASSKSYPRATQRGAFLGELHHLLRRAFRQLAWDSHRLQLWVPGVPKAQKKQQPGWHRCSTSNLESIGKKVAQKEMIQRIAKRMPSKERDRQGMNLMWRSWIFKDPLLCLHQAVQEKSEGAQV